MVDNITADRLAERLDAGEAFTLVDTRPRESYEAWHVPGAENVPYDPREGMSREQEDRVEALADERPVLTICGKGLTSAAFAFELEERGYDGVSTVTGGMESWGDVYEVVPIDAADDDLVVRQLQRRATGCLGYVVGSAATGEAAVVDATRRTDRFEVAALEAGTTIARVFDTHIHADHVSGGPSLAATLGVPYHLGERARERGVEFEFEPLADGDTVEVGDVEVRVLETPGHTTEMVNYLVDGEYLLSGDTLFVDSVGRTELQFGEADAARGARLLYDSLHDAILELPDDTVVLPGHVSVSADGRYGTGEPGDPIRARLGDLRESLDLLGLDEDAFVDRVTADTPEKPSDYERVIDVNTGRADVDEEEAKGLELGPNNCAA